MSYLDTPRVCFSGSYLAHGPTRNNLLLALDDPTILAEGAPWNYDNDAGGTFRLVGCKVTSAWDERGRFVVDASLDAVIGATVSGAGRMADLDPEHRRVTDLFGMNLAVTLPDDGGPPKSVSGVLKVTQLRDYWTNLAGDTSTAWQSVLSGILWSDDLGRSPVLERLRDLSPDGLSVRITPLQSGYPVNGKVLGVIGPYDPSEPCQFVASRRLITQVPAGQYSFPVAAALVDERRGTLVVDLGGLPLSKVQVGQEQDPRLIGLSAWSVGAESEGGAVDRIGPSRDINTRHWLQTSGIVEWKLSEDQLASLNDRRVRVTFVVADSRKGFEILWKPSLADAKELPMEGEARRLVVLADVNGVLHVRVFDAFGKIIRDGDLPTLIAQGGPFQDLETTLGGTWPAQRLSHPDLARFVLKVATLVGQSLFAGDAYTEQHFFAMEEHPTGLYVDVDGRSLRLNPGECAELGVYARRLGRPADDVVVRFALHRQLAVAAVESIIPFGTPGYPQDPGEPINSEPAYVVLPEGVPLEVTTDEDGYAPLTVTAHPAEIALPPARRTIDSQVYFLGDPDGWQAWGAFGPNSARLVDFQRVGAGCALSVLVFNTHDGIEDPTWEDVEPWLAQYAYLYPVMQKPPIGLNLADRDSVERNASVIIDLMNRDGEDPGYMPVTRDLSEFRRRTILAYLESVDRGEEEGG